jgi:hypothetical protein
MGALERFVLDAADDGEVTPSAEDGPDTARPLRRFLVR